MIGMTQQIIYYGIGWDEIRRPPVEGNSHKDTHNNQPKTRGDNGGCKERWHYHQGWERPTFGDNSGK